MPHNKGQLNETCWACRDSIEMRREKTASVENEKGTSLNSLNWKFKKAAPAAAQPADHWANGAPKTAELVGLGGMGGSNSVNGAWPGDRRAGRSHAGRANSGLGPTKWGSKSTKSKSARGRQLGGGRAWRGAPGRAKKQLPFFIGGAPPASRSTLW